MEIKYLDLKAQYDALKDEINAGIQDVLNSTAFVLGPKVGQFECDFSKYCETKFAAGVNSGTSALILAMRALGIGEGDEVITTANTFVATIAAIATVGANVVLVDVDPVTRNINPELIEEVITEDTKAIMPVHLYGRMADMDAIMAIAEQHGLHVIEDAAQAHGARYNGKRAGSIGQIAGFSFYPGKNLGAYGEGGAVVTSDKNLDAKVRMLRDHGSSKKYYHEALGYNARMSGFQGAVLGVKLKHLDKWNVERRRVAQRYFDNLKDLPIGLPPLDDSSYESVHHLYVIECDTRDKLQAHLKENGVPSLIHYPVPVHLQEGFDFLGYDEGDFPETERLCKRVLSLPTYPELTNEQIDYISDAIKSYF